MILCVMIIKQSADPLCDRSGFVLVCNVCSAIMFVLLEYSLKIVVVDGIFDVQTVRCVQL